jgi:hypothetical protein
MNTLSRSWDLISESFSVLRKDKQLVVFPLISGIAALAVAAAYFVPLMRLGIFRQYVDQGVIDPTVYVWVFLWYCTNYFVVIFFNCALAACAQLRFSGEEPTVSMGLALAARKLPAIMMWAIVSATVGTILRVIEDRSEWLGRIVSALLGVAWAVVTYLMIPVLVFEEQGVFGSIQRSGELLKKTWGEQVASSFGFGFPFLLLSIPGVFFGLIGVMFHPLGLALAVLYFLLLGAVMSAVKGVFAVALYRHATGGEATASFSPVILNGAFVDLSKRNT